MLFVQLRVVFCPLVHLSFFCEALSRTILHSSSFPLFHSGKVFPEKIEKYKEVNNDIKRCIKKQNKNNNKTKGQENSVVKLKEI